MIASVLLLTELRLHGHWKLFRSVTELFLSCTRSKVMDIEKSRNSSAVRSGIRNHNCTKRNSEFANFLFPDASARFHLQNAAAEQTAITGKTFSNTSNAIPRPTSDSRISRVVEQSVPQEAESLLVLGSSTQCLAETAV